ncbi:hypothetical protein [Streptomyces celluloflavus]|uniref:hypothetical protein n=1 Tax=Streptomyces celluloflavus TaxID=58344 RepID=UPI00366640CF
MRQNATRAEIVALLGEGLSNSAISRHLRCDKGRVARLRRELDLPNVALQPLALEQKWATHTRPVDGGHLEWTGERGSSSGTPVMRYREESYSPAAVAFRQRHDREPVGQVFAECGMRQCVAPDHVEDEAGRARTREQLRYLTGGSERRPYCRRGHDQAEHGRYSPSGVAYCATCSCDRKRAAREAAA